MLSYMLLLFHHYFLLFRHYFLLFHHYFLYFYTTFWAVLIPSSVVTNLMQFQGMGTHPSVFSINKKKNLHLEHSSEAVALVAATRFEPFEPAPPGPETNALQMYYLSRWQDAYFRWCLYMKYILNNVVLLHIGYINKWG